MRLLFANTEVQNQWKYTLPAESWPFRNLYFRRISMAVLSQWYTIQPLLSHKCAQLMLNSVPRIVKLNVEICHSTCWTAVERCWTEKSLSLFLSTSCLLLNDVEQSFSSYVSRMRSLVERSTMATETAAVLEWNFENVLIWVDRPTRLQNTWFLSSAKRV